MTERTTTAEEVARPLCECHGEPMVRNSYQPNGNQKWACGRKRRAYGKQNYYELGGRERRQALYDDRVDRGVCVRCEGPLTSEVLCWDCLNYLEQQSVFRT